MILHLLEFKPPVIQQKEKKSGWPLVITADDGDFRIELNIVTYAVKIIITKIDSAELIAKKIIHDVDTFHKFSAIIVESYCLATGHVINPHVRSILTSDAINEFERNGWPIGMHGL